MKDYKALNALMRTFRILGWGSFVLALVLSCGAFVIPLSVADDAVTLGILGTLGFLAGPLVFVTGLAFAASMFLSAGVIELGLDITENTYQTKELLRRALGTRKAPESESQPVAAQNP